MIDFFSIRTSNDWGVNGKSLANFTGILALAPEAGRDVFKGYGMGFLYGSQTRQGAPDGMFAPRPQKYFRAGAHARHAAYAAGTHRFADIKLPTYRAVRVAAPTYIAECQIRLERIIPLIIRALDHLMRPSKP